MIGLILSFTTYAPDFLMKIFPPYNLLLASLPIAAALIFGTQSDIIHVWMFWRIETQPMREKSLTTVDSECSLDTVNSP